MLTYAAVRAAADVADEAVASEQVAGCLRPRCSQGTHFTCFTGARVQLLAQKALLAACVGAAGALYADSCWHTHADLCERMLTSV